MKIISGGKKDYYDYLSGIYGIDEDIVYDRRNSNAIKPGSSMDEFFFKNKRGFDEKKKVKKGLHLIDGKYIFTSIETGNKIFCLLEVGFNHYIFMVERHLDEFDNIHLDYSLIEKKEVKEKKSNEPITLMPIVGYINESGHFYINEYRDYWRIDNPILKETWITSLISADEIYHDVYDYLIKLREPDIVDSRNDIQKLESFGFDKKTSFRNPIISANSKKNKK